MYISANGMCIVMAVQDQNEFFWARIEFAVVVWSGMPHV
jgi:hypothetical protein